jgi:hypothetical protein
MDSSQLAIQNTKLANLRTYLAYMRTGFAISSLAGIFKKNYIFFSGLFIILLSTYQYWYINKQLDNNEPIGNIYFDNIPIFYMTLSIFVLLLQFKILK